MMRKGYLVSMAVLAVLLYAAVAQADLIANGSFEDGAVNIGQFITVHPGDTSITGWSVTSNTVDYIGSYWEASAGLRSIDLTGSPGNGTLASTTFTTTPGAHYEILFDMSGNFVISDVNYRKMQVSAGDNSQTYTFDKPATWSTTAMGWQQQEFYFTATGETTTLTFQSLSTNANCGPAIDNVRGFQVPLPPAILLLGSGLAGLGLLRRKWGWKV